MPVLSISGCSSRGLLADGKDCGPVLNLPLYLPYLADCKLFIILSVVVDVLIRLLCISLNENGTLVSQANLVSNVDCLLLTPIRP